MDIYDEFYSKALQYAIKIAVNKRYTVWELEKKLNKFPNLDDESKEQIISRLKELNYLNDNNFIRDFVSDRCSFKPCGKYKLSIELYKKGISKDLFETTINQLEIDEDELAEKALEARKKRWTNIPDEKIKNKAYSFLSSRGFSIEAIYKALDRHYSNSIHKDLN